MERFTTWLSDTERSRLREMASQHGCSQNYLARLAIRQFVGLDVPDTQMAQQKVTSAGPPRVVPFRQ